MQARCDGIEDCHGGNDEIDCNLVAIAKSYNPKIIPLSVNSSVVTVNASIIVHNILEVDEDRNRFKATFKVYLYWKDYRLDFLNLHQKKERNQLSAEEINGIWKPQLRIHDIDLLYREVNEAASFLIEKGDNITRYTPKRLLNGGRLTSGDRCVISRKETLRYGKLSLGCSESSDQTVTVLPCKEIM